MKTYYWCLTKSGVKRKLSISTDPTFKTDLIHLAIAEPGIFGYTNCGAIKLDSANANFNCFLRLLWASNPQLEIDLNIERSENEAENC